MFFLDSQVSWLQVARSLLKTRAIFFSSGATVLLRMRSWCKGR